MFLIKLFTTQFDISALYPESKFMVLERFYPAFAGSAASTVYPYKLTLWEDLLDPPNLLCHHLIPSAAEAEKYLADLTQVLIENEGLTGALGWQFEMYDMSADNSDSTGDHDDKLQPETFTYSKVIDAKAAVDIAISGIIQKATTNFEMKFPGRVAFNKTCIVLDLLLS
jgi:hypothetical protein